MRPPLSATAWISRHGYLDGEGRLGWDNVQLFEATLPHLYTIHLKNTDARFDSTFGFTEAERARGIVEVAAFRDLLLRNASVLPVAEVVGYLEISGSKLGRDYSDGKLEAPLRESLRHLREVWDAVRDPVAERLENVERCKNSRTPLLGEDHPGSTIAVIDELMQRILHHESLVLHGVGDLRYEEAPLPALQPGEALIRVAAAGVCGSDVPRVFDHGTYRFPLIPGHEFAGVIEAVAGPGPRRAGERVTVFPLIPCRKCAYCEIGAYGQCTTYDYLGSRCDGAFAEYVRAPQINLLPVPDGVSLADASLTEPAAVVLHAVRQGDIEVGDAVVVLGCGPIGMMIAQWARILGAGKVLLADIDPRKLALAAELGLGETFNSRAGDPVAWVQARTAGRGADLVIEAAGAPMTFEQSLRMARALGHVVIMGNPAGEVKLPQATVSQLLRKQLTVRGTWNSSFSALPVNEWQVVLDMLAAGRLNLQPLISHRVPLAAGVDALRMMRDQTAVFQPSRDHQRRITGSQRGVRAAGPPKHPHL